MVVGELMPGSRKTREGLAEDFELIMTSHHEAGHTICGLLHYMKVLVVTAAFGQETSGWTHYEVLDMPLKNQRIQDYILLSEIKISYAGVVAERMHYKKISGSDKLPTILKNGSSLDIRSAGDLISTSNIVPPGKKRQLYKKQICRDVASLLEEFWDDVSLVAHALYQKRRLAYEDLKDLLTRKSKHKKFWKQQFKDIATLLDSETLDESEIQAIFPNI
jgi:hypothetical protein